MEKYIEEIKNAKTLRDAKKVLETARNDMTLSWNEYIMISNYFLNVS